MSAGKRARGKAPPPVLDGVDASLLDIVDHVLNKGIVLTGDLVVGVADIDLVYLRLSAVLCAADRVLGASASGARRSRRVERGETPAGRSELMAVKLGAPKLRAKRA